MTYDNIKSHKKPTFTLSLEGAFWEKPQGWGVKLTPPPNRSVHRKLPKLESLFNKVSDLRPGTLLKRDSNTRQHGKREDYFCSSVALPSTDKHSVIYMEQCI